MKKHHINDKSDKDKFWSLKWWIFVNKNANITQNSENNNECVIMEFVYNGTYDEEYHTIKEFILDVIIGNSHGITKEKPIGPIGTDDKYSHIYDLVTFSLSPYTLQYQKNIDG